MSRKSERYTQKLCELYNFNKSAYDIIIDNYDKSLDKVFKLFPVYTASIPILAFTYKWIVSHNEEPDWFYAVFYTIMGAIVIVGAITLFFLAKTIWFEKFGLVIVSSNDDLEVLKNAPLNSLYKSLIDNLYRANLKNYRYVEVKTKWVLGTYLSFITYLSLSLFLLIFYVIHTILK